MNRASDDTIEISLANDAAEIAGVAARVDEFCEARDISPAVAYAVNLAIDELLTNTISYGYGDDEVHRIDITLGFEAGALVVVIADDSAAFDPTQVQEPDTAAPLDEREAGGLGLHLVTQMMDGFEYRHEDGRNIVTLTKNTAE